MKLNSKNFKDDDNIKLRHLVKPFTPHTLETQPLSVTPTGSKTEKSQNIPFRRINRQTVRQGFDTYNNRKSSNQIVVNHHNLFSLPIREQSFGSNNQPPNIFETYKNANTKPSSSTNTNEEQTFT